MALHQILHMRGEVASQVMLALEKTVVEAKQPTREASVGTGEGAAEDEVVAEAETEDDGMGSEEDDGMTVADDDSA